MRRILLVIDDYQELVAVENLLRRIGFDVMSLGKDVLVKDALLRFHPDIAIATAKGHSVDGLQVATRVKRLNPQPRVALTYVPPHAPNLSGDAKSDVDALIVLPVQPSALIRVIAKLANLDSGPLIGKYQKLTSNRLPEPGFFLVDGEIDQEDDASKVQFLKGETPTNESRYVQSAPPPADEDPWSREGVKWDPKANPGQASTIRSNRSDKYDAFLRENDEQVNQTIPREKLAAAIRKAKRASETDDLDKLEKLEEEKRAFVKALFEENTKGSKKRSD